MKILIIGAGLAGLSAGIHLQKQGYNTKILEINKDKKKKLCGV